MNVRFPGEQNQDFRYLSPELRRGRWPRALDAGCGRGLYMRELAASARLATGVDQSVDNLRRLGDMNGPRRLVAAQLQRLPYRDNSFDLVLCIEVLTHIPPDEQHDALSELFRVLRPGGALLISVHNLTRHKAHELKRQFARGGWTQAGAAVFPVSLAAFRRAVERAGFDMRDSVRHLNYFNGFSFELAHRRPYLSAWLARIEDFVAHVPVARALSITMFAEAIKPPQRLQQC